MQDVVLCLIVLGIGVFGYFVMRGVDRFWDRRRAAKPHKSAFFHTIGIQTPIFGLVPREKRRPR